MIGRKYELGEQISETAFFTLHSARDTLSGRAVSVRLIKSPFREDRDFLRGIAEAQTDLDFESDTNERLIEFDPTDDPPYLVGDLPQGSLLADRIRVFAPFSVPLALGILIGIVEGLTTLHAMSIVHGDLGPHNVVATHGGGAKLMLGGFWKAYRGDRASAYAALEQMAPYMAPELVDGQDPDPRSDIYSVGIILFELLTKRVPFRGETALATITRHQTGAIPSARGLNPSVPPSVDALLGNLLAKRPEDRPQSAEVLLDTLRRLQDQLRFGRQTRAPKAVEPEVAAPRNKKEATVKPAKIAPNMPAQAEKKVRTKPERDVPAWMLWSIVILFGTMLGLAAAWVIISFQKPREFSTPDVRGLSLNEAQKIAESSHLRVRISERVPNDKVEAGHVIETRPTPKERIREGGTVYLKLSLGKENVAVPDLKGRTVDEARAMLGALDLEIDGSPLRQIDNVNPLGSIVSQRPAKGQRVLRFSKVRVWIAATPDAPPGTLPGETAGPTAAMYDIRIRLTDTDVPVKVRIDVEDAQGTRTILEEEHEPNDEIKRREVGYGSSVVFRVYYDGELRKEIKQAPRDPNEPAAAGSA